MERNPWERLAAERSEVVEQSATFLVRGLDRLGGELAISPLTLTQVLVARSDSVVLGSQLDDVDLFRQSSTCTCRRSSFPDARGACGGRAVTAGSAGALR